MNITGQVLLHRREGVFQVVSLVVLQTEDQSEQRIEERVSGGVAQEAGVAGGRVRLHRGAGDLSLQQDEEMVRGHLVVLDTLEQSPVVVLQIQWVDAIT